MGNRDYKRFAPGSIYHVYNRGVGKMDIFNDTQDYQVFISRLKENLFPELEIGIDTFDKEKSNRSHTIYKRKTLPSGSFSLIAYCLMPNHFHFLIKQNTDISISRLIGKICTSYSKYFNLKNQRVGSLFQDQFKSVQVDTDEYLSWLSVYIHLNPIVANLVKYGENWKWCSYLEYLDKDVNLLCDKEIILGRYSGPDVYQKAIDDFMLAVKNKKYSDIEIAYAEFEPLDGAHQGER